MVLGLALLGFPRAGAAQNTHLLVVTGVSGDAAHAKKFHEIATRFIDAAKKTNGVTDANLTYLAEKTEADPERIGGRSTRENIAKAVADIAARARPNDEIFVLMIGHGSFDSRGGAFNLPGPDLTAEDYAKLLAKWPAQRVAFVNTASASGAFLPAIAGPGRTIVTATRTGRENFETRFPPFFVEAYEADAADRDRNGRVSVLEAFDYAKAKVEKAYEQDGLLPTEHATLDDGHEGGLAATMFLASGSARAASTFDMTNPAVRQLVEERDALEQEIAGLRLRKDGMDPAEYERQLEKLLLALARKSQALQKLERKKP
ncbi:MAG: hypothetical protein HY655_04405 [Acidobacteria bacterium]|nr:hypothetical protein [Acidobacteriota bacterium]